jgi:hypothetical protein
VPSGQHHAMACGLIARLPDHMIEEVTASTKCDVFDDGASCCSFAIACSSFSLPIGCTDESEGLPAGESGSVASSSEAGTSLCANVPVVLAASAAVGFAGEARLARVRGWVGEQALMSGDDPARVVGAAMRPCHATSAGEVFVSGSSSLALGRLGIPVVAGSSSEVHPSAEWGGSTMPSLTVS